MFQSTYQLITANKNHQSDFVSVSLFVHKAAQKSPNLLRCCSWRYIPMNLKVFVLIFALALPSFTHACVVPNIIRDGGVIITRDEDASSGMYHVRVPAEYKGARIKFLILSASKGDDEISLPLSIKSKDGITGSYFYLSSHWVDIRVSANYKGM
jgi:hypothetical protein